MRLDLYLVTHGLVDSRTKARKLIDEGSVVVNGEIVKRASHPISHEDSVQLLPSQYDRYVGQGGLKLAHALQHFSLNVNGLRALDVGASTGGFTDCLLQNGASCVYAVDVGHGQLHESLREDPRVHDLSGRDIRGIALADLDGLPVSMVTCDVSFISLHHVLPSIRKLITDDAFGILLIKPQFEVGPGAVGRGGVVKESTVRKKALARVLQEVLEADFLPIGLVQSPLGGGREKNVEYLLHITCAKSGAESRGLDLEPILQQLN